jgi:hypothetical protein
MRPAFAGGSTLGLSDGDAPVRARVGGVVRSGVLMTLLVSACAGESGPEPPLRSGDYAFVHRFAEHPSIEGIELAARIRGRHIVLVNDDKTDLLPAGVIAEGTLMWHAASEQWIIGMSPGDANAADVGGCSDGPEVVDLERRIYWTC